MTSKQYRTAMGKVVDMGAIMLQNENTRAVGNMAVNARGDRVDTNNRIIDKKSNQIKRQQKKQTVSAQIPATTSNSALKKEKAEQEMPVDQTDTFEDLPQDEETAAPQESPTEFKGGLAAAIAKAKTVQQEKITPPKQASKAAPGVRKL
jgi:hypothetical protein